jgi:hypothetical protein
VSSGAHFKKATVTTERERENKIVMSCPQQIFWRKVKKKTVVENFPLFSGGLKRHPTHLFCVILFSARALLCERCCVGRRREGTDRREKASSVYLSARKE